MEATNPTPEVTPSPEQRLAAHYAQEERGDDADDQAHEAESEDIQEDQSEQVESADQAVAEEEPEQAEADEDAQAEEGKATELTEIKLGLQKFKVDPRLAEAVKSIEANATRNNQAVAEQRKAVEDKSQYLEARELILKSAFKEAAEVESIQAQLQQFDALDWNSLFAEDSNRAIQLNFARQQLQSKLGQAQATLNQTIAQAQQAQAQHLQKQTELGRAELQRRLGKASEAELQATWKQGLDLGFSEHELKSSTDPRLMHALFKAAKFDAMSAASKTAVEKKVAQAKPMTAPTARTAQGTAVQAKQDEIRSRLKKSGRSDDAEALLRHMFERKRVR